VLIITAGLKPQAFYPSLKIYGCCRLERKQEETRPSSAYSKQAGKEVKQDQACNKAKKSGLIAEK